MIPLKSNQNLFPSTIIKEGNHSREQSFADKIP